jgi:23S rRNA (uracil1939-C5)-methyltransferase
MMAYKIERLGHLGDGLATGPIFAARTLPGELVSGDLIGNRLQNIRIVQPSEQRISSDCSAFKRCGGCALHHAHPDFVANWKKEVLIHALGAHGIKTQIQAIQTSPKNSRRRVKLSGKRTKSGAVVGFFGKASGVIHSIDPCKLLVPEILATISALERFTAQFGSRKGLLEFWLLSTSTGIDVSIDGLDHKSEADLGSFAEWARLSGIARLSVGDQIICEHQTPWLKFGQVKVSPPPRGFTQATLEGERALQGAVARALNIADSVIDLFSGMGTLGLPLSEVATLHCVESDGELLDAITYGVRHTQGIKKVTTEKRDLFRNPVSHADLVNFNAAIIDPPRAGAEHQVRQLAQSQVHNIAMVSCNPVSFARDASLLLEGGYILNWTEVVDQFRWSSHIEVVAHFQKN